MIGRTIRPRPLSYTERIPVIFLHRPKDPEDPDSQPLDPALEQFLKACEDEREQNGLLSGLETSRRRRKNRHHRGAAQQQQPHPKAHPNSASKGVGSPEGGAARKGSKPVDPHGAEQGEHRQRSGSGADGAKVRDTAIAVPTCREILDYASNEQAMDRGDARRAAEAAGPSVPLMAGILPDVSPCLATQGSLGLDAAAYIIYQDLLRDRRAVPALLQYDMDDEDEAALLAVNASIKALATKTGSAAASRTPPTTRGAAAAAAAIAASMLDEDGLEALVGALERAHFDALQQRKELWQAEVKAGRVPKLPVTEKILPWEAAAAAVQQHQPPLPALPRGLYNYWLKRRKQEGGPLLEYLWYEQPWKAICFRDLTPGHEGEQGDMPFMAAETKNSTRAWNRVRIDKKEAHELIEEVREEFELLRTLADQVRKRERLKKQLLKLYRAETAAKLGLNLQSRHAAAAAAAAATATGTTSAGKKGMASPHRGASNAAGAQAAAAAAAAAVRPGLPPRKRRRVSVDEVVRPTKGAEATAPVADTTAVVDPTDASRAKGASKQRQPTRGNPSAAGGARNARAARVTAAARRTPAAQPPPPASAASPSAPSSSSGAASDSSRGASSSARSGSNSSSDSEGTGSESTSGSHSGSDVVAEEAGAAHATARRRKPPAATRARGASRRRQAGLGRNARVRGRSPAAAEGDASGSSEGDSSDEEGSAAGEDGSASGGSSSSSGGGSDAESGDEELSSSRSGLQSRDSSEEDDSDAAGSQSTSSETGADEDEPPEEEEEEEEAGAQGAGQSVRRRGRRGGRARSTGRGMARNTDDGSSTDEDERQAAGADGHEAAEERGQDGHERGRRGRARRAAGAAKPGSGARARSKQRGSPSHRQQPQQPSAVTRRARARSRSATRASAAAAKPPSASPAGSPSSSQTRSSSPTRSGRDLRAASSSPEPSRSPSRSPPPPGRVARRGSAPLAHGRVVTELSPASRHRRRRTVGGATARRAARQEVRVAGQAPGRRDSGGGSGCEHVATRPNRELAALLRTQPGRGKDSGAVASPQDGKAKEKHRTRQARPRRATVACGDSTATKGRTNTGGAAAAEPTVTAAPAKSPLTGSKRPLEQGAAAATAEAPSSSPCHKKSNLGWRKELASLIGRPLAATTRFLLRRKQLRTAATTATDPVKGREGHGAEDAARRNSMLRERNGTVS